MSTNTSDDLFLSSDISLPHSVRFWLLLLSDASSVLCSICIILHIILNRTQRYALQNHTIFLILICNLPFQLLDTGLYLFYLRYGFVQPSVPSLCLVWWFVDYYFFTEGTNILVAWLAVERHILIFHDRWVVNQRGRFLFHYLPLIVLVTYGLLFYIVVFFFLPCENTYDYSQPYCGFGMCYESYSFLNMWETVVHYWSPMLLESIASVALIVRVHWQKRRLNQSRQWRKQRRMIIQLILVSVLNTGVNMPINIINIAQLCGFSSDGSIQTQLWLSFVSYWIPFLFPFASLCQFPVLRKQIREKLSRIVGRQPQHGRGAVVPIQEVAR